MKDRIAEKALVLKAEGHTAKVRLVGGEACRKCGLATMGLCKPGGTGMVYEVTNDIGAGAGDMVKLGLNAGIHAKGYFLAYVMPLALFAAGSFGGWLISEKTGIGGMDALLAVLALCCGLAFSIRMLARLDRVGRMFIKSIVNDVPDFDPTEAGSAEGLDYLRAYRQV